jgi:hypothetical protein
MKYIKERRPKHEGHISGQIRRLMIQKNHGDKNKFTRKIKHKSRYEQS